MIDPVQMFASAVVRTCAVSEIWTVASTEGEITMVLVAFGIGDRADTVLGQVEMIAAYVHDMKQSFRWHKVLHK